MVGLSQKQSLDCYCSIKNMFKDLKDIPSGSVLSYDVCIVGSGPAGITVARQLLGAGYRIVLLESGGEFPESKYQQLNKGENSGASFLSLDAFRGFGGASKLWAGVCSPFKSDDFNEKPFIPLSGWPISFKELKVYYQQAAKMLGISFRKFYGKDFFQDTFNGLSFNEFNRVDSFLSGRVFQISSPKNRDFGSKYKEEINADKNTDVIIHSTVTKINLDSLGSKVVSVSIADLNGNKTNVHSKIFVLACGAIENPRILLSSRDYYKRGIGNTSGFVGACFMSHPGILNVAEIHRSKSGKCINKDNYSDDYIVQFGLSDKERQKQEILDHGFSISNYSDLSNLSTIYTGKVLTDFDKLLSNFTFTDVYNKRQCRDKGKYTYSVLDLGISLEQPPLLKNRISLLSKKDALGVPVVNIHWSDLSKIELKTIKKATLTLAREFGVSNSGRVKFTEKFLSGKGHKINDPVNHHIGTTRMSDTKKDGVVNKNCKVFDISNLYIAGSSVFSTSSKVNPTFTIIALALRLGNHIKSLLNVNG
jgi:choline dehydrogenase-like flavoprotein